MSTLLGFLDSKIKDEFASDAWKANKIGGRLCVPSSIEQQELNDLKRYTVCEACDERMVFVGQIFCPLEIDNFDRYLIFFTCNKANCKRWSVIRYLQEAAESNPQSNDQANVDGSKSGEALKEDWLNDQDDWNDDARMANDESGAQNEIDHSSHQNRPTDRQFIVVNEDTNEFIQPYYLQVEQEDHNEEHAKLDSHVEELLKSYKLKEKNEKSASKDAEYTKIDETDLMENYNNDVQTYRFYKKLSLASGQVIRYGWNQKPLLNASDVSLETTANCEQCGSVRVFEFQLMPALINYLKFKSNNLALDLDFASVLVFTCKQNCSARMLIREAYLVLEEIDQNIPEELLKG